MRELVYLSEAKLNQFRPEHGRRFRVREVGVPGLGQVGIDSHGTEHLDEVIDHLSGIARWYQEDGLAGGEWVQFEAALGYTVLELGHHPPVLLFAEEPGRSRRLVLHGSPHHLADIPAPPAISTPWHNMSWRPTFRRLLASVTAQDGGPGLHPMLARLKEAFTPDMLIPMTGYARVTTLEYGDTVVASPLFVAYDRQ